MIMCGTCCVCCVSSHGVLSVSTGRHSTYFHRIYSHFKIKSTSQAVRNIIPSNNGLGVEKIVIFLVAGYYFVYVES